MKSNNFNPDALKRATSIIDKLPNSNFRDAPEQPVAPPNEYLDGIRTFGPPGAGKTGRHSSHAQFLWAPPPEIQDLLREPLVALKEDKVSRPGDYSPLPQPAGFPEGSLTFGPPGQGKTSAAMVAARETGIRELNDRGQDKKSVEFIHMSLSNDFRDLASHRLALLAEALLRQDQPLVEKPQPDGTNDSFGM